MISYISPATNASYPIREGNSVQPLIDTAAIFDRICERIEKAQKSVWATIASFNSQFEMPGGRGSVFDVCEAAVDRGIDVRLLFWRCVEFDEQEPDTHFHGLGDQAMILIEKNYRFLARWDAFSGIRCHHQKSWLIDAATPDEVGFVGGANPGAYPISEPGHHEHLEGRSHDLFCEIRGPAATDVHHNFVQRWNEASDRDLPHGAWPSVTDAADLSFPVTSSALAGDVTVQIARTIPKGHYQDSSATPNAPTLSIEDGEESIMAQYLSAINNAQQAIYIENQYLGSVEILEVLEKAVLRGVEVVYVLPGTANGIFSKARRNSPKAKLFRLLDRLAEYENFSLAALCSSPPTGDYCELHVHAKIAIVDGHWTTIGSCNLTDQSLHIHSEMNATIWDDVAAGQLLCTLMREHLDLDTVGQTHQEALKHFHRVSRNNTQRKHRGEKLNGLAYWIDPKSYGLCD